jgi:hypothetical protein
MILNTIDSFIGSFSAHVYYIIIGIIYTTYLVTLIGVAYIDNRYAQTLNTFLQTFIAIVLMIRFNPLRKNIQYTTNDQTLIFASAFYLLSNDQILHYVTHMFTPVFKKVDSLRFDKELLHL